MNKSEVMRINKELAETIRKVRREASSELGIELTTAEASNPKILYPRVLNKKKSNGGINFGLK